MKNKSSMFFFVAAATLSLLLSLISAQADILYVVNNGSNTIEQFDASGTGTAFATTGLAGPTGLTFDSAGNLYAANNSTDTITKFSPDGSQQSVFASTGLSNPRGLAIDSAGNIYAANQSTNVIEKFTPAGVGSVFANTSLRTPNGLAFDSAGNLYVANGGTGLNSNTIVKFASDGTPTVFATDPGDGSVLSSPNGLAFDSAGNLYVANGGNNTIVKFAPDGTPSVFANTGLSTPRGIAFDSAGNMYVSNAGSGTITKFSPDGTQQSVFAHTNLSGPSFMVILSAPQITSQPSNQIIDFGQGATFSVTASGVPAPTYQWQVSTDGGQSWNNVTDGSVYTGTTTATLILANITVGMNGYEYQCIATNSISPSATSNAATLTLDNLAAPQITQDPADQTVNVTDTATFSVTASGTPAPTFQWQLSTDSGQNWNNVTDGSGYTGATTASLSFTGVTAGMNGYKYRCVAANGVAPDATSNAATLTVNLVAPQFTQSPTGQTVVAGQTATFTVAATGTPTPTLQWQLSTDSGQSWNNLSEGGGASGTTSTSLSISGTTLDMNGYEYRCVATNGVNPDATSDAATLTVETPYMAWQSDHFSPTELSNPSISGDTASPSGDRVANLLKYAFNGDPHIADSAVLPAQSITTSGGQQYLTVTFIKVASATDITYVPQFSTDLKSAWNTGSTYLTETDVPDPIDPSLIDATVVAVAPVSGSQRQFIRIQVTRP